MITADTITDAQIKGLLWDLQRDAETARFALELSAGAITDVMRAEVQKCRARCAEVLNARTKPAAPAAACKPLPIIPLAYARPNVEIEREYAELEKQGAE